MDQADALSNPVLLLVEPARSAAVDRGADELSARLQSLGRPPGRVALDAGFAAARPASRAAAYRQITEFLNVRLLDFAVKIGATKEVP